MRESEPEIVDVTGTARVLAQMLKSDPQGLDKEHFARGDKMLTFYQDTNFGANFKNMNDLKVELLTNLIDDLADRARMLSKAFFGISFTNNKLQTFVCDYGKSPDGTVVYKVGLRDVAAFQRWRSGQNAEITADDINSSIYRLTVEWSRLL
jgi:hypothetical protein